MAAIARCYQTGAQAQRAYQSLLDSGYPEGSIAIVIPESTAAPAPDAAAPTQFDSATPAGVGAGEPAQGAAAAADSYSSAIKAGSLLGAQADFYLSQLKQGYSLVAASPAFGSAFRATQILDEHQPLALEAQDKVEPEPFRFVSEQSAPLSSFFGLSVLTSSSFSLSAAFGLKSLSRGHSFLARWFGEIGRHDYTLSGAFGMRLLSSDPAPLSSKLGMPTKSGKSGDRWTRSMGFRMLSDNAAPVSGFFGIIRQHPETHRPGPSVARLATFRRHTELRR